MTHPSPPPDGTEARHVAQASGHPESSDTESSAPEAPAPEAPAHEATGTEASTGTEAGGRGPTLLEQMGGVGGLVASVVPVVVFIAANTAFGLRVALWSAVGAAVLVAGWRLVRREPLQPAVSGALGVGLCAFIAYRTGEARDFFLYGIWFSLVVGVAFAVSVALRRPLVGVIWAALNGAGSGWRTDPRARFGYDVATVVWAVFFLARFVVQRWLYDAQETELLGVARLLMGLPLTAVAALVTIWAIRRARRLEPA